jgi:glyoxylase-like metal-dependent hydrolase (beta-lactamase superfamily II)
MRIRKAEKINDHLWLLGTEESCVYLVAGSKSSAIISAGMNFILPDVLNQLKDFQINEKKIAHMIILHAHFDHVGIVPYFQRHFQDITIYASQRGWEVLANSKAINVINQFSRLVTKRVPGAEEKIIGMDWEWRDDIHGTPLKDGDKIDLGGMQIDILETPGHSSCSISAYIACLEALFPSDAVGIPYKDDMLIAANSNFTQYQQSLTKLLQLPVKILGADHYACIIGEEAQGYVQHSVTAAKEMRSMMENALKKEGNIDQAAQVLVDEYYRLNPEYFLAPDIMLGVYRQMLKHLSENMTR